MLQFGVYKLIVEVTKFIDGVRSVLHNQCKFIHIVVGPRVVIMAMGISYFYVIQHSS